MYYKTDKIKQFYLFAVFLNLMVFSICYWQLASSLILTACSKPAVRNLHQVRWNNLHQVYSEQLASSLLKQFASRLLKQFASSLLATICIKSVRDNLEQLCSQLATGLSSTSCRKPCERILISACWQQCCCKLSTSLLQLARFWLCIHYKYESFYQVLNV